MTTKTAYAHGEFSWTQLATIDDDAAKRFYGSLFGWEFNDTPAGPMTYTMCRVKDRSAAGLFAMDAQMRSGGVPAHWESFVNVTSADGTARKVTEAGGRLLYGPEDVLDVGRLAAFEDPTGARLAVWQARKHPGAGIVNEPNAMCWNELMTPDVERAGRFYKAVFGWTADLVDTSEDSSYTIFKAGTAQVGGMMARPPRLKDVPPNWLTYFAVANCDAAAGKVGALGGQVIRAPDDIPNVGRFAVCRDDQGAVFALFTPHNA